VSFGYQTDSKLIFLLEFELDISWVNS